MRSLEKWLQRGGTRHDHLLRRLLRLLRHDQSARVRRAQTLELLHCMGHCTGAICLLVILREINCSQVVVASAGIVAYPWDSVCRRLMMQSGRKNMLYTSAWDCTNKIIRDEGVRGMYKVRFE